ncbi:MAG: FAD-dependent oxidoreductase [Acidimicrobiales bacterium]
MKIAVVGAGMIGLCTATLLAQDGHEVTVVDRDEQSAPDPSGAWNGWQRTGVAQFRLAHFLLSRFRVVAGAELPDLVSGLDDAGACHYNVIANIPDEMKGGARPDDDRFDVVTARRPVAEAVVSRLAEGTPGVTVRRGHAVASLLTGAPSRPEVPHVTGVTLDNGDHVAADLVVDSAGRRSPLPRWLDSIGAKPLHQEVDDSGFVYFGRHFASSDGSLPAMIGPLKQDCDSIGYLTLPADNGTWSVVITASSEDAALRRLTDPDKWAAVVRMLPLAAHWIDAPPIDDRVAVMAKIEDRIRDLAPDGLPVATGVTAVGDAWSCTNPSLGRGMSIGLMHAVALRDYLRDQPADPWETAAGWADITRETCEPWFRTTRHYDALRLQEIQATIEGRPFTTDDPAWRLEHALGAVALQSGDNLRGLMSIAMMLRTPEEFLEDRPFAEQVLADAEPLLDSQPPLGPTREQLLAAVA